MPWYFAVAERDHEIQNPTNAEKIALLGNYLRLTPDSRVIDLACGKGGPAILLASTFGCTVLGIERAPEFVEAAQEPSKPTHTPTRSRTRPGMRHSASERPSSGTTSPARSRP